MDATLINSFPETLKYVQKNNVIESVSSIELSNSIILNEILDFSKIIKTIGILFIIATFNLIFPYEDNKDSFNYKLYITLLFILLAYIIYTNELYITVGVFIFVAIFIIPLLIVLYIYLEKNETINIIFYSYNNQLKNVFSNNFNNYELIFNIFFISIIFILSIVLYWDNVYADAKKISKCGQILQIIEENTYKKKPYVYNIIIIDNDSLDIKISNYIIKITYDFIKMKTIIEYVKYNTVIYYTDDEIKEFRKKLIINIIDGLDNPKATTEKKEELKSKLKDKSSYIDFELFIDNSIKEHINEKYSIEINNKFNKYILENTLNADGKDLAKENIRYIMKDLYTESEIYNKIELFEKKTLTNDQKNVIIDVETECNIKKIKNDLLKYKNYNDNSLKVKYFNLRNMDVDTIENINPIIFNSPEKYKYLCVDENNNPIYNYSSKELIKFTKNYAKEQDYNPSIIYDIIYAKINNDKVFT
jgi:hypothetical protein